MSKINDHILQQEEAKQDTTNRHTKAINHNKPLNKPLNTPLTTADITQEAVIVVAVAVLLTLAIINL